MAVKHGMTGTRLYKAWTAMISRCHNPNHYNFAKYGAKGISVCERWRSFENFYADMGDRPEGMSIDRIDSRGNYEPSNCRWASDTTQANNRSSNRRFEVNGEMLTVREISELTGIPYKRLRDRILDKGWDVEQAINTPLLSYGSKREVIVYINEA